MTEVVNPGVLREKQFKTLYSLQYLKTLHEKATMMHFEST